jgi:urocanate hydratase
VNLPQASDGVWSESCSFQLEAYACYRALSADMGSLSSEPALGGKLLYAGELDELGRAMMVAGNVAGCATLAGTGDAASQRMAIRDGVADFVVTSLDEALRILKNEIRKHNTVSVCIGMDRGPVEREMIDRGVLPDLIFAGDPNARPHAIAFGGRVREILPAEFEQDETFVMWQMAQGMARWMPKLDAIVAECLDSDAWSRRWLRLSSRYCGRAALTQRVVGCTPEMARKIVERIAAAVENGQVETEVAVTLDDAEESRTVKCTTPKSQS